MIRNKPSRRPCTTSKFVSIVSIASSTLFSNAVTVSFCLSVQEIPVASLTSFALVAILGSDGSVLTRDKTINNKYL